MTDVIYLDTHVLVWIITKQYTKMSKSVLSLIDTRSLKISPIVLLEFRYLVESNKYDGNQFAAFEELKSSIGLEICSESFESVIKESLSISWTRDHFDRIIVAQSQLAQAPLLTKDRIIHKHYSKAIWD